MRLEWHDNNANVGRLELRVRRSIYAGKWNAIVFIGIAQLASRNDFETDAAARAWCEEWIESLVGPALATARAEAALAEREACAQWFDDRAASHERSATLVTGNPASFGGGSVAQELAESLTTAGAQARLDARVIRARTAPATLSSDTLAAIAEARGLRLVEPEHLAELEALRAAVDEETALDRERSEHGCGDASCVVERATGMTTNGGCRCGRRALRAALQRARKELAERGGKDGAK